MLSELHKKSWFSEYTDEKYHSIFDCLACYRWYIIPQRLRKAAGLPEETDIEVLLDSAGYATSLIAEELFSMLDICLESQRCSIKELDMIRQAYNGLSGFSDSLVLRIVKWGPDGKTANSGSAESVSESRLTGTAFLRTPVNEAYCSA